MRLSGAHQHILLALTGGYALKSHRDVNGGKVYQLHPLDGPAETVARSLVEYLQDHGLIDSNKKFPVAAYWLTETGKVVVTTIRPHRG